MGIAVLIVAASITLGSCATDDSASQASGPNATIAGVGDSGPSGPVTKARSIAEINAACTAFYRIEPRELGVSPTLEETQRYARRRVTALATGLLGVSAVRLRPADRSLGELVRDNFSSAKAIYEQIADLPAETSVEDVALLAASGRRLVNEAGVALITFGATSCAPPADQPAAAPGAGAGPLTALEPAAVIKVADPLLDNKSIVADRTAVWVAIAREPSVVRIDPTTDSVVARIAVPSRITQPLQLIDGRVWVSTLSDLVRIDPATNRVDWSMGFANLGPPDSAFTVARNGLWVCDRDVVHRIDIRTQRRTDDVRLPGTCQTLTAADGHITVSYQPPEPVTVVSRIDPRSARIVTSVTVPVDSVWGLLETPAGQVFIDSADALQELDVAGGRTIRSTPRAGTQGNQLAFDGNSVWATRPDEQRLVRFDVGSSELEEVRAGPGVIGVAYADGSIWATNSDAGTVMRFPVPPPIRAATDSR